VLVDGRSISLRKPAPLSLVLRRAHVEPRDGLLRAAGSGRVLDAHADPAVVFVDGKPARLSRRVRAGDHVGVLDGRDRVESVLLGPSMLAPVTPLPDLEGDLWTPAAAGLGIDVVGALSGEVVHRDVLRAPVSAARVPGQVIALSFDDGPDPRSTPRVLSILAQYGVHATFCVIGYQARAYPELVKAIHDGGNTLCDHTEHHPHLDQLAPAAVDGEIASPAAFIQQLTGAAPAFMRPPYGGVNATVIATAHRHGLRVLEWSVDPEDFDKPNALVIASRVLAAAHPGAVVLLHDGGGDRTNTVAALPGIILGLRARGYTIVTPTA